MSVFLLPNISVIIVIFVFVFLFGIIIGSFLNVCIYRIPLKENIAVERSHCMKCGHVLSWYELVPLFSYLIQGGKCRSCKAKISPQYPIVEALNGILWVALFAVMGLRIETLLFCLCTSALIVLTVIDERTMEIPLGINIFIASLGAIRLVWVILGLGYDGTRWYELIIGFFAVSLFFFLLVVLTKGRAMGGGDVKLMAAAGLLLGWKQIILAMVIGCLLGSVIHIIRMKVSKKEHKLAFGPYLAGGIYLTMLFGTPIINWYVGMFISTVKG